MTPRPIHEEIHRRVHAGDHHGGRVRRVDYWSSVAGHSFQAALLREIGHSGWRCEEHSHVTQARYRNASTWLRRLALRWDTYGLYPLQLRRRLCHGTGSRVAVLINAPFYAPVVAAGVAHRGVPLIHWVMDIYPDALIAAGKLSPTGIPVRVLRTVVRKAFTVSCANVFLGERLLRYAEESFGSIPHALVIPIGADGAPFRNFPPGARQADRNVRVLYCGNMGHLHDTTTIAAAIRRGLPRNLELSFRGNGAGFHRLRAELGPVCPQQVTFGPNLPEQEWAKEMLDVDVALVTMREGAEKVVMPSKAYSAMVAGQAILAVCPAESDLADLIRQHRAGWQVAPGSGDQLCAALKEISGDANQLLANRREAWRAGHDFYDQSIIARRWIGLLDSLV